VIYKFCIILIIMIRQLITVVKSADISGSLRNYTEQFGFRFFWGFAVMRVSVL